MIIAVVIGFAGLSFLKIVSKTQLGEAKASLAEASIAVEDSNAKISEIGIYDKQLETAAELLDNHLAPSLLFEALELNTVETIFITVSSST